MQTPLLRCCLILSIDTDWQEVNACETTLTVSPTLVHWGVGIPYPIHYITWAYLKDKQCYSSARRCLWLEETLRFVDPRCQHFMSIAHVILTLRQKKGVLITVKRMICVFVLQLNHKQWEGNSPLLLKTTRRASYTHSLSLNLPLVNRSICFFTQGVQQHLYKYQEQQKKEHRKQKGHSLI